MEINLEILAKQSSYPVEAFIFVQQGLDRTVRQIHGEPDPYAEPGSRHVGSRQLCLGLRDHAIDQYGLLARSVLQHWHIHECKDFGQIVFAMVDAELMAKTDEDTIEEFIGIYDFAEAFSPTLSLSRKG